jgi:hypothetical protein
MQLVNLDPLPPHARTELLDFYEFLLMKYAPCELSPAKKAFPEDQPAMQPRLGDLAVKLFGTVAGIELNLPRHPPHEPLELGQ